MGNFCLNMIIYIQIFFTAHTKKTHKIYQEKLLTTSIKIQMSRLCHKILRNIRIQRFLAQKKFNFQEEGIVVQNNFISQQCSLIR